MAPKKKVSALIKLQIQAGKANPAPPLGPALGSHGVNIMDFCKAYNAQTQDKMGQARSLSRSPFTRIVPSPSFSRPRRPQLC